MPPPAIDDNVAPASISPAVVREAADWLSRLWSGEAGPEEERACAAWRAQNPEHELAWQRLQQIGARLNSVPAAIGRGTLRAPRTNARRTVLRMLGWGIVAVGAVGVTRESALWHYNVSDYSTGAGEWKHVRLPDGSQLMLNTATAVDIDFNAGTRRVYLRAGEIYIITAPDSAAPPRPFLVETSDGAARALGTRYSVRKLDNATQVAVYEHAVEIAPYKAQERLRLSAGQQAELTPDAIRPVAALDASEPGWTRRRLLAERMRLADFLEEIGRYRSGIVRCDPRVADLRITGVFPLDEPDRALAALEEALPVKLEWATRYWLSVRPRSEA
jgi:transmembrane sensor